jgi:hypothetical protein
VSRTLLLFILCGWLVGAAVSGGFRLLEANRRHFSGETYARIEKIEGVFGIVPILTAMIASGNAHAMSDVGGWIGSAVQWTAFGLLLFAISRLRKRRRMRKAKNT